MFQLKYCSCLYSKSESTTHRHPQAHFQNNFITHKVPTHTPYTYTHTIQHAEQIVPVHVFRPFPAPCPCWRAQLALPPPSLFPAPSSLPCLVACSTLPRPANWAVVPLRLEDQRTLARSAVQPRAVPASLTACQQPADRAPSVLHASLQRM